MKINMPRTMWCKIYKQDFIGCWTATYIKITFGPFSIELKAYIDQTKRKQGLEEHIDFKINVAQVLINYVRTHES